MLPLLNRLRKDERGFVQSAELVLIATITVIGMIVGLSELTWNVNQELQDVGNAFNHVNQGYSGMGTTGPFGGNAMQYGLDTCG